ncbi:hypothetical protein BGZ83_008036 [Gryganskiella cystojenkinii]|nr:hypothetical protein BGZ83_008036 [Gryganskiella cystojenkinii]
MSFSQTLLRELRTRAVGRWRPTGPDRTPFERPLVSELVESKSLITSESTSTVASTMPSTTVTGSAAPAPKKIQRGFPSVSPSRSRSNTIAEDVINNNNGIGPVKSALRDSSTRSAIASVVKDRKKTSTLKSPSSETTSTSKSTTKEEKFPKKLQAFPFVPGATSGELAKAHKFFFLPADFVKSATNMDMIPENTAIPEVAFIGRSNIGKSSLINGLVNRNGLVKTSSKPGHTKMMNFFKIGEKLSLVDMPGYGWKSRDEWGGMILEYLQTRKNLRRIYILIDPSHGLKESDTQIMKLLDGSGLSYQVVLTKVDRLSKSKYKAAKAEIEGQLVKDAICCFPMVLGVSSKTKDGLDELRAAIVKAGQLTF